MSTSETKRHSAYRRMVFGRRTRCKVCGSGWWRQSVDGELLACGACGKAKQEGNGG
jgi:hypothetical protein